MENQKILMVSGGLNEGAEKKIDYKALLHQYVLSKWYLYVLFFVISIGLVYLLLLTIEPQYEINSRIVIRQEGEGRAPDDDMLRRSLNLSSVSKNALNEVYVLNSFSSFYEIVEEMDLNIIYYWKKKISKQQGYKDFPIAVDTFALNPYLGKDASFDFKIRPTSKYTFEFIQDTLVGVYTFGKLFSNNYGSFKMSLKGDIPYEKDYNLHIAFLDAKAVTEGWMENLNVEFTDKKATVLELTLKDAIPERGVDIMVKLIEKYQEKKLKEKNEMALNTLQFIDDRLQNIGGELSNVETTIEQYKLQNDISSETTSDLNVVMDDVSRLTSEQGNLQVQLKVLESLQKTLEVGQNDYELIPVSLSIPDYQLQKLIEPYNELVLERRRILTTGGPSNPIVQTAEQKLSSMKRSIYAAVDNLQNDVRMKLGSLENQYNKGVSRLRSVPRNERNLLDKSRQKEYTEKLYLYLLEKKEETALTLIGSSSNFRMADAPRSSLETVSPNKKLFYFGGALAGLGIPFLLIIGMNLLKDFIQTEEELKEILPGQHIAGSVFFHKRKRKQEALIAENFSSLRMNLQFRNKDRLKGILVTSSVAGEGKTFVATHLAFNFAKAKIKTVLVDFDLRKPSGYKHLVGKDFDKGLSDYLKGDCAVQDIIRPVQEHPNLYIIPGGTLLSNPMELISETKITELFSFLESNYDVFIVDTSPIGIFSDVLLLNGHLNNSLFIFRAEFTKRTMVEDAEEIFRQGKLVNPSLVLNGMQVEKIKNYKYYRY